MLAPVPAHATVLPSGFTEFPVASGLASPTAIAAAPDGRLFVCEQGGRLRLIKNGALLSTPFVTVPAVFHNELGLLGVALDPDFAANGYVYVYYSVNQRVDGTPDLNHRVSRFTASGDVAVAGSERVLLEILDTADDQYWHNGGALRFGADGKLLIAVGDRSQPDKAELRTNLQGKLLRMNADGSIPTDNPFYTTATGVHRLIWAYGLRNPYTFDTQPGTGRVFINDVGNRTWEEINDGIAGSFYGWDNSEGPTTSPGHRSPIYAYANDASTCAIVGAAFYNPPAVTFPAEYAGRYFFADHCARWIRMLDPANGNAVTTFATDTASALVDLEVGPDGSLFYLSQGTGAVRRISYTAGGTAPVITTQPADQTATVGQPVTFSVTASGAAPITYQWQRNNVDIAGATSASYRVNGVAMADNGAMFRCHVSNNLGSVFSRNATLTVTENRPPVATITAPADGTLYTAGQAITFTGTANDPEEGALPPSAFTWRVDFHHDTHTHPHLPPTSGATGGSFTPPTSGESSTNVWFRIHLSVVDSGGLAHEVFRDVMPRITRVTLATGPAGLAVNVDGAAAQPAPVVFDGVAGMTRTIGTTTPQTLDGQTWYFASWSDGGALEHPITVPSAAATFTATFSTSPAPPTPTPTPVPTNRRVEQDDPAVRNTGTWFTHTRTMHSAGSSALAMDTGSDATLTFQGTSVTWRGLRDPWSGLADVYVDGTFRARIDTYSAVNRYQDALYSIAGLAPGTHTLRIVVTGERSAASAGQWVWVDAFDVAGEAAPTPTPTSTPMPTATATPTVPPTDTPPPTATPTPTATAPPTSTPTPTPTTRPTPTPTSAPVTVTWINLVRASASGGTLTKTGTLEAYDAGAISSQSIASGDGSVEFTTPALGYRAAGLGVGDSSQHYSDIDFAIFTRADGSFNVMEKGTVLAAGGTYAGGDLFRIGIAAGVVRYYRNGALVHTSTQAVAYPLVVDTALYTPGVQVGSARLGTASSTPPPPTPTPTARPVVTPTPTPPPGGGRIEQNNTAVQYAGTWFSNPNPGHSGGSAALAMDAGSTATLAFQGTGVTWIGMRDPWSGQADVYIDGQLVTRVDTYAAGDQHQATLYSTSTLPAGAHTIRIVVTGQRNAASGGSWIWIDAFDVTGTSVPTATPTPRPIVTATPTPPPATPTPTSTPGGTMTPTVAPPTPTPTTPPPTPTPTPPPRATPTPTPGTTRYDQTHAAVTYAGAWFTQTKEVHSGGSAALAMDAGSEVSFPFNGTGVRWIGVRDQWAGEADVYVDGAHKGRIDTYSATELTRNVVYSATGLAAGPHTIRIVVPGTRNPASGGAWVWVDAFDVVGGTAGP